MTSLRQPSRRFTRWGRLLRGGRVLLAGAVGCALLGGGLLARPALAQGEDGSPAADPHAERLRQRQLVQLSPHVLRFDPQTPTATLEFRNASDSAKQAEVQVQFAYLDWHHGLPADTLVIDAQGEFTDPYDTVIVSPGPRAPFAGRWLSGMPTHVRLAPHQTQRVTVRLVPPVTLPAGEYWARIVTIVRPNDRHHGGRDVQQTYVLPTTGRAIGAGAVAQIDVANRGAVDDPTLSHALWVRLPVHLTGNVPFRGMLHSEYRNLTTGEVLNPNRFEFLLMKDAVVHAVVETDVLSPGPYEYTLWFDNERTDLPAAQRLPMLPVRQSFRFEVKPAWAY